MYSYIAYSMHIISEIPLLLPQWEGSPLPQLTIRTGTFSSQQQGNKVKIGTISYWVAYDKESLYVELGTSLRLLIHKEATIIVDFLPHVSEQIVSSGVVSVALTLWIKLHGYHTFHGSALCTEQNQGILFLGDQGSGKSTTAANLAKNEYQLLCDDVIPLSMHNNTPMIHSGISLSKLLPDTLHYFGITENELSNQFDGFDKYAVSVPQSHQSVPLTACFVIEKGSQPPPYFSIIHVYGMEKIKLLCTHHSQLLEIDSFADVFAFIAKNLATTPVLKIIRDSHISSIEKLGKAVKSIISTMSN